MGSQNGMGGAWNPTGTAAAPPHEQARHVLGFHDQNLPLTEDVIRQAASLALKRAHPDTRQPGDGFRYTVQQVKEARDFLLRNPLPNNQKSACKLCGGVGMIQGVTCVSCGAK